MIIKDGWTLAAERQDDGLAPTQSVDVMKGNNGNISERYIHFCR
jgi:hypothetical protein